MKHRRRLCRRDIDARPDEHTARGARVLRTTSCLALAAATLVAGATAAAVQTPTGFLSELVVDSLSRPTGMAFLPDGRLLVTEQLTGRIRLIVSGHVAATDPAGILNDVNAAGTERGVQSLAVDPRWPAFPYVYVIYTRLGFKEAIVRLTGQGDVADPAGENLVLTSPLLLLSTLRDQASNHNGGGLRFGPDGMLYASLGDDADPCSAQHPDSLRGALLRLDVTRLPAGGGGPVPRALLIPADNPLSGPDSNARMVYAYGLRNPWRFHIDPATGAIFLGDVGEIEEEELDEILPGGNYGWPFREGASFHPIAACVEPPGSAFQAPKRSLVHDDEPFLAILTAGFYRPVVGAASNWPAEYWGDVFYGDHFDSRLRRLRPSAGWTEVPPVDGQPNGADWATGMVNVVDATVGPDGSLWWLQAVNELGEPSSGGVHRIRYTGAPVSVPIGRDQPSPRATPNPFRASIRLSLDRPLDQPVRITVFDVAGRARRASTLATGGHVWEWDGRDEAGRAAAPGVYLVRFQIGDAARTLRILRLE